MPLYLDDLPISETDAEQIVVEHFDQVGVEALVNVILTLGQLDPLELVDGQPRWSDEQRIEIIKANEIVTEWRDE